MFNKVYFALKRFLNLNAPRLKQMQWRKSKEILPAEKRADLDYRENHLLEF